MEEITHPTSPNVSGMDDEEYTSSSNELKLRKTAKHNMSDSLENSPKKHHEDPSIKNIDTTKQVNVVKTVTQDFVKTPSITKMQGQLSSQVTSLKVITPTNASTKEQDGC